MIRHLELFAGIGGFRRAFDLLGNDSAIPVKCVGFSEIDPYAVKTYQANFETDDEIAMGDIVSYTSIKHNISNIPDFDILTGGFPCQSFSMMGKKHGFDDIRGNVFFHIIDIINEKKPTFILLENVKNIIKHDKGNTIKIIIESIKKAGYPNVYLDVFNTENFGLAQKRNRVYIFASSKELPTSFKFNEQSVVDNFKAICSTTSLLKQKSVLDVLQLNADKKYYLSETLKPTILANGSKNFKSKSEINQLIARPLTATMVKLHRACQDNYYSDDFLFSKDPKAYLTQEFSKEEQAKHNIRRITPNEAFALQGFDSSFYKKALDSGLSHFQLYKQAGNAVSVNTVYAILHYLFVTNKLDKYVF